jgi:hypothetical protein
MAVLTRRFGAAACAAFALLGASVPAGHAQGLRPPVIPTRGGNLPTNVPRSAFTIPNPQAPFGVNPLFRLTPNLTLPQAAFNTNVANSTLGSIPPYIAFSSAISSLGNPYASTLSTGGGINPYSANLYGGGYGGYGGGGYGGYGALDAYSNPYSGYYPSYDPFSGYLRGAADITNANGRFLSQVQQARLLQAQADTARLDFRRKAIDEANYERSLIPSPEAVRQKNQLSALDRARHNPPFTEILSGQALNDLFNHVAAEQAKGVKGPNVPLDENLLKSVNLKGANVPGNISLLKDDGRLTWPPSLRTPEFEQARTGLSDAIGDAVKQIKFNKAVPPGRIKDMRAELQRLNDILNRNVGDMPPSQYIEARRYLNNLADAVKALDDPNAVNYFNGSWTPQARNVAELVEQMRNKGLQFAPAGAGDEPAYNMIYQALAAFDSGMTQVTASRDNRDNK